MPPTYRYSSDPLPIPSSFPVMACTVGTMSNRWTRFQTAALVIASVIASMLVFDQSACAEPARPMSAREGGSAGDSFAAFIVEASQRFGVPASWVRAVMRVESVGDVHALSPKGAMGLMQT